MELTFNPESDMANGSMPSWEEWNGQLTEEQRQYSQYKILESLDTRLRDLEKKPIKNIVIQLFGSFMGGVTVLIIYFSFFKDCVVAAIP